VFSGKKKKKKKKRICRRLLFLHAPLLSTPSHLHLHCPTMAILLLYKGAYRILLLYTHSIVSLEVEV